MILMPGYLLFCGCMVGYLISLIWAGKSIDAQMSEVKENILKILNQKYGITEEDFRVAELEIVPAGKARNVGLDNSMIAGHGHDDRVCAYTTLKAMLEVSGTPAKTAVALFADLSNFSRIAL